MAKLENDKRLYQWVIKVYGLLAKTLIVQEHYGKTEEDKGHDRDGMYYLDGLRNIANKNTLEKAFRIMQAQGYVSQYMVEVKKIADYRYKYQNQYHVWAYIDAARFKKEGDSFSKKPEFKVVPPEKTDSYGISPWDNPTDAYKEVRYGFSEKEYLYMYFHKDEFDFRFNEVTIKSRAFGFIQDTKEQRLIVMEKALLPVIQKNIWGKDFNEAFSKELSWVIKHVVGIDHPALTSSKEKDKYNDPTFPRSGYFRDPIAITPEDIQERIKQNYMLLQKVTNIQNDLEALAKFISNNGGDWISIIAKAKVKRFEAMREEAPLNIFNEENKLNQKIANHIIYRHYEGVVG